MKAINLLYIPLSRLYGAAVWLRNFLYEEHLFRSKKVDIPTICVGNLTVGGTGKTPHVEYLLRLLTPQYKVAVLSRGYKRKTRGFVMADAASTAKTIGDEAMQIYAKFPNLAVAVCEDRLKGVRLLQRRVPGLQVILLDDAFQHRAIRCGYNILLTPYDRLYIHDHMLPWGRLRDTTNQAIRAHLIVVTKCPDNLQPIDRRITENNLALASFQHLCFSRMVNAPLNIQGNPLVVTGIAMPDYLMNYVRQQYPNAELLAFPDHHTFTDKDIQRIAQKATNFDFVLTTEKDYQRLLLTPLAQQLGNRLHPLPMQVDWFEFQQDFDRQVLTYIKESLRHYTPLLC